MRTPLLNGSIVSETRTVIWIESSYLAEFWFI